VFDVETEVLEGKSASIFKHGSSGFLGNTIPHLAEGMVSKFRRGTIPRDVSSEFITP
jgi:hypothetical protein